MILFLIVAAVLIAGIVIAVKTYSEAAIPYDYKEIAFYFLKQLDEMPAADVRENVRGEWVNEEKHYKDYEQEFYYIETTCSNCGAKPIKNWILTDFCPNCGAKMEDGADGI